MPRNSVSCISTGIRPLAPVLLLGLIACSGERELKSRITCKPLIALTLLVGILGAARVDAADLMYRVTIENLTPANGGGASQVLSPSLIVAHKSSVSLFAVGQMAIQSVIDVAEDAIGATGVPAYTGNPGVAFVGYLGSPLPPGQSLSFDFSASDAADQVSLVTCS